MPKQERENNQSSEIVQNAAGRSVFENTGELRVIDVLSLVRNCEDLDSAEKAFVDQYPDLPRAYLTAALFYNLINPDKIAAEYARDKRIFEIGSQAQKARINSLLQ